MNNKNMKLDIQLFSTDNPGEDHWRAPRDGYVATAMDELFDALGPIGGVGRDGSAFSSDPEYYKEARLGNQEYINDIFRGCADISRMYNKTNPKLAEAWKTVSDFTNSIYRTLTREISLYESDIVSFINSNKEKEQSIETAINVANDKAQEILNKLGLGDK